MKNYLVGIAAICVLLCILASAGCVSDPAQTSAESGGGLTGTAAALIDEISGLQDGNIVISTYSINQALGMVLAGAENVCRTELETYLGTSNAENLAANTVLRSRLDSLQNTKLTSANSVWFNTGFQAAESYQETLKSAFDAEIKEADFSSAAITDAINAWCAEKTNNLIKKIADPSQLKNAEAVLINAVYLKAEWLKKFRDWANTEETFKGLAGDTEVAMMHGTESVYLENAQAVGFKKYYGDNIAFIGILPKKTGDFTLKNLNLASLLDSQTYEYDVKIGIPKFSAEFSMNLAEPLKKLGLSNVFSDEADSFDGIGRTAAGEPLKIDSIIHKTFLNMDEDGTEAAAVTAAVMMATSAAPEIKEIKTVVLDRPFAFLIVDEETDTLLFAGKITDIAE